jgi:hypothetical protein
LLSRSHAHILVASLSNPAKHCKSDDRNDTDAKQNYDGSYVDGLSPIRVEYLLLHIDLPEGIKRPQFTIYLFLANVNWRNLDFGCSGSLNPFSMQFSTQALR